MFSSISRPARRLVAKDRGQVMVLGCVALIIIALMMSASFTLANAVHEKIRIQAHSDAQAYSLATVEARAFNVTAHYNRAIAAALVAQMSLHSWMAIVTADVAMLYAGVTTLGLIAAAETALGCYPYNFTHCICVVKAIISGFKMYRAARKWAQTAKGLESQFNKGVDGLKRMIDSLHKAQTGVLSRTKAELYQGTVLSNLRSTNASKSSYAMAVAPLTYESFACALEGSEMDTDCKANGRAKASLADRSRIIQNTANATRHAFAKYGASSSIMSHKNFNGPTKADVPQNALTDGNWAHFFVTSSRVGQGTGRSSNAGHQAQNVGAFAIGGVTITNFRHIPIMGFAVTANIISGQNNQHRGMPGFGGHSGNHTDFESQMAQEPCNDQNCFINFRADPRADNDFGQPTTYGAVTQSLRVHQLQGSGKSPGSFEEGAPWEINKQGTVKLELAGSQAATTNFVPRGKGFAVSKAKVYFHQLGNWQVAPNFFDPFWRAKLHFFKKDELNTVLQRTGDTTGIQILNSRGPVEGEKL